MSELRVVVVGAGGVLGFWEPALRAQDHVAVVAVVEPDPGRAAAAAERLGCVARPSLAAAEGERPDLVVILAPPGLHRRLGEEALALGCHVISEKPIALSLGDALALVEAARAAGRTYAVMQQRRYHPAIRALRAGLERGELGTPLLLCADMLMRPDFGAHPLLQMESPLLLDMAIHTFDQARFLSGADAVAVTCHEWNPAGSRFSGAAAAIATFELDGGAVFSYRGSWATPGFDTSYDGEWRITGTAGTALWRGAEEPPAAEILPAGDEADFRAAGRRVVWPADPPPDIGHTAALEAILAALRAGAPPETDAADNIRSFAMVESARRSAREGRRVELAEVLPQAA